MRHLHPFLGLLLIATGFGPIFSNPLAAQDSGPPVPTVAPQELKTLTLDDYGRWSTIGQVALSADGRWMTFSYAPNDGDSKLFLRDLNNLDEDPVELSVNGTGPVFSDDSRWLAFISSPGEGGGRQGPGPAGEPEGTRPRRGPGPEPFTSWTSPATSGGRWKIRPPSPFPTTHGGLPFTNPDLEVGVVRPRPGEGVGAVREAAEGALHRQPATDLEVRT